MDNTKKIKKALSIISDSKGITAPNKFIKVYLKDFKKSRLSITEINDIFLKLQADDIIKIIEVPEVKGKNRHYIIAPVNPNFTIAMIEDEIMQVAQIMVEENTIAAHIEYNNSNNHITLHTRKGFSHITKPNWAGTNITVFEYLYKRPNQLIKKSEIEKYLKEPLDKSLNKFVNQLHFKGLLRSIFFSVTGDKIIFNNPATYKHIKSCILKK